MSSEQCSLIPTPPERDQGRLVKYDAYFTPRAVARQLVEHLRDKVLGGETRGGPKDERAALRFLDPSAGAGVFGSELRRAYPHAWLEAVEPRAEEHEHLRGIYDVVHEMTFEEYVEQVAFAGRATRCATTRGASSAAGLWLDPNAPVRR